jgi:hypothetical protein
LNTNEPPDDPELALIHSVISDADARLACLDDEISTLEEKLQQLEEEHASLSHYRTRNKAILSPLRRMPSEVLGEIFLLTLPSVMADLGPKDYLAGSPWVLPHISSRWREISLSTPSLWSRIALNYSQTSFSLSPIEAQIQRARNLKIHFYGSETADAGSQIQMFQLLSQHSSRWEELCLGLTPTITSYPLSATNFLCWQGYGSSGTFVCPTDQTLWIVSRRLLPWWISVSSMDVVLYQFLSLYTSLPIST